MSLRVAIIDDHRVFRDALRALFAARDDIELVGEAGEIDEACELVATARPDVVLMDAMLGPDSGFEIAEALRRTRSPAKILFLSALRDESTIARALASGARGFVSKEQPAEELVAAIHAVASGRHVLPPGASGFGVDDELARLRGGVRTFPRPVVPAQDGPPAAAVALARLTQREREVFSLLVDGCDNAEVARRLMMSVKTAETHRARLLKKLGVHSLAELVRFAARNALL